MRTALTTGVLWGLATALPAACPICFQMEPGPVTDGVRAAVFVLVGVTVSVLSGAAWFIRRFVRRAAALGDRGSDVL